MGNGGGGGGGRSSGDRDCRKASVCTRRSYPNDHGGGARVNQTRDTTNERKNTSDSKPAKTSSSSVSVSSKTDSSAKSNSSRGDYGFRHANEGELKSGNSTAKFETRSTDSKKCEVAKGVANERMDRAFETHQGRTAAFTHFNDARDLKSAVDDVKRECEP